MQHGIPFPLSQNLSPLQFVTGQILTHIAIILGLLPRKRKNIAPPKKKWNCRKTNNIIWIFHWTKKWVSFSRGRIGSELPAGHFPGSKSAGLTTSRNGIAYVTSNKLDLSGNKQGGSKTTPHPGMWGKPYLDQWVNTMKWNEFTFFSVNGIIDSEYLVVSN